MKELDTQDNNIEQSQETRSAAPPVSRDDLQEVHDLAEPLMASWRSLPDGDMVGEIVANALKLLRDQTNRGDIKLINKSLQGAALRAEDLRALPRRAQGQHLRLGAHARERTTTTGRPPTFGKAMADAGWMVITGAGGGIMAAGHGGAGADPSFGLAIRLPFEQKTNPYIANDPKLINFKYFFTRKLMFVRSSHAIACLPRRVRHDGRRRSKCSRSCRPARAVPMPIVFVDSPGGDFWQSWQKYVREPAAHARADRPGRPAPLQDHRQRRRGGAGGDALLQQLPQRALRQATRSSSACTAGRRDAAARGDQRRSSRTSSVKGDFRLSEPAARRARTSRRWRTCTGWSSLQPPRPRPAADADQLPERSARVTGVTQRHATAVAASPRTAARPLARPRSRP